MCQGEHPFIPAGRTIRVTMEYLTPGGRAQNVYNVQKTTNIAPGDLADVASSFAAWETAWASQHRANSIGLINLEVRDISTEDGLGEELAFQPPIGGAVNSPALPSSVTLAVGMRTGLTGRSRRGRSYWIGLAENMVNGDDVTGDETAAILQVYTALHDIYLDPLDMRLAVVSYCSNGVWRTNALVTPVTRFTSDGVVDNQRRRLKGRGM